MYEIVWRDHMLLCTVNWVHYLSDVERKFFLFILVKIFCKREKLETKGSWRLCDKVDKSETTSQRKKKFWFFFCFIVSDFTVKAERHEYNPFQSVSIVTIERFTHLAIGHSRKVWLSNLFLVFSNEELCSSDVQRKTCAFPEVMMYDCLCVVYRNAHTLLYLLWVV